MMKRNRNILLMTMAAAMMAACSQNSELAEQTPKVQQTTQDGSVQFDAYLQRSTTRAGYQGDLTSVSLREAEAGFGVFGYYTDNFDYTPTSVPNFMFNEKVTHDGVKWDYEVTKYWPNEFGSMANSADQDRVSFFAYAPYIAVEPTTGFPVDGSGNIYDPSSVQRQTGITGMKRNSLSGDPVVYYVGSFNQATSVDLCWGVVGQATTWPTNGATQQFTAGYPWLNVRRPDAVAPNADSQVKFTFKHALAKLIVNVQTNFESGWTNTAGTTTKVWIRSIRFSGIAEKAALNLNNPTKLPANQARWIDYYGTNELEMGESVTVYDGRKDGSEGLSGAVAANETVTGLNPQLIQDEKQLQNNAWITAPAGDVRTGVTSTPVNMFANGSTAASYVYVIPTGERVDVEICYDVETIDKKLPSLLSDGATHGSTIENRIAKTNVFASGEFTSGKAYTLNLLLGLKDVQFTADITSDWESGGEKDIDLPSNGQFNAAVDGTGAATIPYDATSFTIGIRGLNGGEAVNVTAGNNKWNSSSGSCPETAGFITGWSADNPNANANGFNVYTLTTTANTTTSNRTQVVTWTGATSGKKVTMTFTQAAAPLMLQAPSDLTPSCGYYLRRDGAAYGFFCKGYAGNCENMENTSNGAAEGDPKIEVWLNGTPLEWVRTGSYPAAGQFNFNNSGRMDLNLPTGAVAGNEITVTLKTGDAPAETITFTVQ